MRHPDTPAGLLDYHGALGGGSIVDMMSYAVTMGIVWLIVVAVSPWQAGRNLMAKNEHVTFRAGSVSAICTVIFLTYLYLMAVAGIPLNAAVETHENVLIWLAFTTMPKIIGTLLLAGVMAAGLSSATTFLSVIGFSLTNDVLCTNFADEKKHLRLTKLIMLVFSVIALILAYFDISRIRIISWFASTIIASSWGYCALASVWNKKFTERGAFFSMAGGFTGYIVSKCLKEFLKLPFNNIFDPFFIGLAASILCGILLSRGQERTPEETAFYEKLHITPQAEKNPADYKRNAVYGWIVILAGVVFMLFLLFCWAVPYNSLK
jgi:sodium/pantothenate symporter